MQFQDPVVTQVKQKQQLISCIYSENFSHYLPINGSGVSDLYFSCDWCNHLWKKFLECSAVKTRVSLGL